MVGIAACARVKDDGFRLKIEDSLTSPMVDASPKSCLFARIITCTDNPHTSESDRPQEIGLTIDPKHAKNGALLALARGSQLL